VSTEVPADTVVYNSTPGNGQLLNYRDTNRRLFTISLQAGFIQFDTSMQEGLN